MAIVSIATTIAGSAFFLASWQWLEILKRVPLVYSPAQSKISEARQGKHYPRYTIKSFLLKKSYFCIKFNEQHTILHHPSL
ncbi:hypothetical protein [Kalamiella sp. sgz302252]|uniref:hypothetical protein n=1 Tax=Pantoea sp. sgz302252 TaxID=3341827 RepID=UPI0036D2B22D